MSVVQCSCGGVMYLWWCDVMRVVIVVVVGCYIRCMIYGGFMGVSWWFYGRFMVVSWWFYGGFMVVLWWFHGDFMNTF